MNYLKYKEFLRKDLGHDVGLEEYNCNLENEVCRLVEEARDAFQYRQDAQRQFQEGTWHGKTTKDYRDSLWAEESDNMFTLAYQWQDKPHRHVFDLCDWIDELLKERAQD
jgi:hypothetical protein